MAKWRIVAPIAIAVLFVASRTFACIPPNRTLGPAIVGLEYRGTLGDARHWRENGSLSRFTDPTTQATSVDSDLLGRPLKRTYPDSTIEQFSYEGARLKISPTGRDGPSSSRTTRRDSWFESTGRPGNSSIRSITTRRRTAARRTNKDSSIFYADLDLEGHITHSQMRSAILHGHGIGASWHPQLGDPGRLISSCLGIHEIS